MTAVTLTACRNTHQASLKCQVNAQMTGKDFVRVVFVLGGGGGVVVLVVALVLVLVVPALVVVDVFVVVV